MPFSTYMPLEDMVNPDAVDRAMRRITSAAGERMESITKRLTPVSAPDPFNRGRPPGALRDSIERTIVEAHRGPGGGYMIRVYTESRIAPYVEWTTRPHMIRPRHDRAPASVIATRRPRRMGNDPQAALAWRGPDGRLRFAREVHHPGTRGQHPFSRGALETEADLPNIAHGPLRDFERELVRAA
jgi:hypothetical protein